MGLFDLVLQTSERISLFGDQVFSGAGGAPLTLIPGTYASDISFGGAQGTGSVTLTSTPEPATWLLVAPAFALLTLRRRK